MNTLTLPADDIIGPLFMRYGNASSSARLSGGVGSGPVVFLSQTGNQAAVLSPFSNFMAASVTQAQDSLAIRAGFLGSFTDIPAGSTVSFILWYGPGVNAAMTGWGAALLQRYGKAPDSPSFDYTATHLMYNTDHGAAYYYTTAN